MSILSPSFCWFSFIAITQTQSAKRTKYIGEQNVDLAQLVRAIDAESLREELETCRHFVVDSVKQNGRYSLHICDRHTGCTNFEPKTRHSVRKAQVRRKVECCVWLRTQECRRGNLSLLLCTGERHFDGVIKTCSDQSRVGENEECVE